MFGPAERVRPTPSPSPHPMTAPRRLVLLGAALAVLSAALPQSALALASPVPVAPRQGKPDQVYVWNARRAEIQIRSGTVSENSLSQVVVSDSSGKEQKSQSADVRRVTFGSVPTSYADGVTYLERDDFENAVAKFRLAATDSEAREVVQADARYKATLALIGWGANDASRFTEAAQEADRFLSAFPNNRNVPDVRTLKARATHLTGNAAAAAAEYRAVFDEGKAGTEGYRFLICARAGLEAGHCLLEAGGDTLAAREVFSDLDSAIAQALSDLEETAPERKELMDLQARAQLGEGYVLLATASQARQAKLFFEGRKSAARDANSALRFGVGMGLALAEQSAGEHQKARLAFLEVASLEPRNRDRIARALVGAAQCFIELKDTTEWSSEARKRLEEVASRYGDTPSARVARELLEKL